MTAQTWTSGSGGVQGRIREDGGLSNVGHGVGRGRVRVDRSSDKHSLINQRSQVGRQKENTRNLLVADCGGPRRADSGRGWTEVYKQ